MWTLVIIQGSNRTKMVFGDFNELASYMTRYKGNYSEGTLFVIHNDGWPDTEIYVTRNNEENAEEVLPDGF